MEHADGMLAMSRLYFTEQGRAIPNLAEELTRHRRVRKVLKLPVTRHPAVLFILAQPHAHSVLPLCLSVNGNKQFPIRPLLPGTFRWHMCEISPACLVPGANTFELWADGSSMTSWSLATEPGHAKPASYLSDDSGENWRNTKMTYLNVLSGEYVIRIRLHEGEDPPAPPIVWEVKEHSKLTSLRALIPQKCRSGSLLERVRGLTAWLSTAMEHIGTGLATLYTPWDPATILAWGMLKRGLNGQLPVLMCMHYSVAFVSFCHVLGIRARCAALANSPNGSDGHFVSEVWFPVLKKWVMVDVNFDIIMWKDGVPLSISEIQAAGSNLQPLVEYGQGSSFQLRNPAVKQFFQSNYLQGKCFTHRSIWPRTDFLSRPDLSPVGHGTMAYSETELVWECADRENGFGMFQYFGTQEYFQSMTP